jgi:hypothetical protein
MNVAASIAADSAAISSGAALLGSSAVLVRA